MQPDQFEFSIAEVIVLKGLKIGSRADTILN